MPFFLSIPLSIHSASTRSCELEASPTPVPPRRYPTRDHVSAAVDLADDHARNSPFLGLSMTNGTCPSQFRVALDFPAPWVEAGTREIWLRDGHSCWLSAGGGHF